MKILIDIGHPAQVHQFKNLIWNLKKGNHKIKITARAKEITLYLLDAYGLEYEVVGKHYDGMLKKIWGLIRTDYELYKIAKKFKPDLFVAGGSMYPAHVSKLIHKQFIAFDDTEHASLILKLYTPFTKTICTPSCFKKNLGSKQVRYNGYHELAYLHPNYFKPNKKILKELGIKKNEKYFILRFISWKASHDVGHKGINIEAKRRLIKLLNKYGKVFISSEDNLLSEFKKYKINISPEKMHDALYYATMYIGEGGTMVTESAVLGTPAIYISSLAGTMGNFIELETIYDLCYSFNNFNKALIKIKKLLENQNIKKDWEKKKKKMLKDKIDVTKFMAELIKKAGKDLK